MEIRKRSEVPWKLKFLSICLFLLPFANFITLHWYQIPSVSIANFYFWDYSTFTKIIILSPLFIAPAIWFGKKEGWYLFLMYSILLVIQNIYSFSINPGLQNLGVLFRTFIFLPLLIWFCKSDIAAPYLTTYPRGWRGQKRLPIQIKVSIHQKEYVTADASLGGVFLFYPNCPFQISDQIDLEMVFGEKRKLFQTGVVRVESNGVGLAFRNLDKESKWFLKNVLAKA